MMYTIFVKVSLTLILVGLLSVFYSLYRLSDSDEGLTRIAYKIAGVAMMSACIVMIVMVLVLEVRRV